MAKMYKRFKAWNNPLSSDWCVVTNDEARIIVAVIPSFLKHQKAVATALADGLTNSKKYVLTDLI